MPPPYYFRTEDHGRVLNSLKTYGRRRVFSACRSRRVFWNAPATRTWFIGDKSELRNKLKRARHDRRGPPLYYETDYTGRPYGRERGRNDNETRPGYRGDVGQHDRCPTDGGTGNQLFVVVNFTNHRVNWL